MNKALACTLALASTMLTSTRAVAAQGDVDSTSAALPATGPALAPFDVNDIAWLFPRPSTAADLTKLISMDTLKSDDGTLLWPQTALEGMLAIADGSDAQVPGIARITLPPDVRQMSAWKIAGVRFDASAPGSAPEIIEKFGSNPQIRLILQPVTEEGAKVHDIAVHVIYNFSKSAPSAPNTLAKAVPDRAAFKEILRSLDKVRKTATDLGAPTTGQKMNVHPGLASSDAAAAVLSEMRSLLTTHLPKGRLRAMAIMGLPNEFEPWIFVAIVPTADGKFAAAPGFNTPSPGQKAELLSFSTSLGVSPTPLSNNRNPITNQTIVAPLARRGVSTAILFGDFSPTDKAVTSKDASGMPITDAEVTNADIVDIVSHPRLAHFFNTDCVSCHTESTRSATLGFVPGQFAFQRPSGISDLSDDVKPFSVWNLRNFGWGPGGFGNEPKPTVTRRTFNEIADAADFINHNYLP